MHVLEAMHLCPEGVLMCIIQGTQLGTIMPLADLKDACNLRLAL